MRVKYANMSSYCYICRMGFNCTSCGLCCKNIQNVYDNSVRISEEVNNKNIVFPYTHIDGVCEKLIDNKCSIYKTRPMICNVDAMSEILRFNKGAFYKLNAKICNELIKENNLPDEFIVKN